MTTLVIDELRTTLEQDFQVANRIQINTVRPMLYIHNAPAGSVTVTLKKGSTILSSATLSIANIISMASLSNFTWGTFSFYLDEDVVLHPDTDYTLELSSSGYSYSESSYIGMVKPHENPKNTFEDTAINSYENAFGFELWGYK